MAEKLMDYGDEIDESTFEQILEMDDDPDDRDFSRGIVVGFIEQADQTFEGMDQALVKEDLKELSRLGHFLKGSSATLGLNKVSKGCEHIQHYGERKDEQGEPTTESDTALLQKIKDTLKDVKKNYTAAEKRLKAFYGE